MKSLTKVLSAFLVICMFFSMNVFADDKILSDIDSDTLVGKAVNDLISLNIIDGYTDGTFKPDNTVTRAEMAKLIVAFLRLDEIGLGNGTTGFADVDETNHWSQPYVKVAVAQNIIIGYDDGTFRPDNPVKYSEAVKMIVCALGYGPVAESRTQEGTPWYSGYISVAAEKGVLSGATTNNQEDPASRGTVAVLLYNALDVNVGEVSTGKNGIQVSSSNTSAREKYQQSEKLTGVVTAVYQTGLDRASTSIGKRFIEVKSGTSTEIYRVGSGVDTYSYLGYRITANINTESLDEYSSLDSIRIDTKNNVTEINADDIDSVSTSGISYWSSERVTKTTNLSFDPDVSVIYNGRYLEDYTTEDFDIKAGTIKAVDNDGDADADVVFISSYEIIAIKNIGTDSTTDLRKIYALYNEGDIVIPSSGKLVKVTNSSGTVVDDPQSITASKYDIANLLRSKDGEVFDLTITKNSVTGEITSIINDTRIAIDNVEYDVAYNFDKYTGSDKPEFKLSSNVSVYLDINGDIAAAEVSSNSAGSSVYVGYLLLAEKGKGMDGNALVKLYGLTNVTGEQTYKLASKVTVDGKTYSNHDKILQYLAEVSEEVNEGKENFEITPTPYAQLIKYTLRNGLIDSIDTIRVNSPVANDDLVLDLQFPNSEGRDTSGRYSYISGNKFQSTTGSTVMAVNSSTKILVVPDDMNQTNKFRIVSTSYFTQSTGRRVEGYNLNNVGVASYVLVYGGIKETTFNENSDIALTKSVALTMGIVNGDEVQQDKFTGWNFKDGKEIADRRTAEQDILFKKVEQGEIFRYLLDTDNNIDEIEMVLEIEENDIVLLPEVNNGNALEPVSTAAEAKSRRDYRYDPGRTAANSVCRLVYGTVLNINDDNIRLTNTLITDDCGIVENESDTFSCSNYVKVFVLDLTTTDTSNRIHADSTLDEIKTLEDVGDDNKSEASQVLLYYQNGTVRTVIIVKR